MKRIFITLFMLGCTYAYVSAQSIIYVASDATGNKDGSSWADAFTTLDSAFDAYSNGDSIFIKVGNYTPDGGGTNSTFAPPNGSKIFGGFNGTEKRLEDRSGTLHSTLDGNIGSKAKANDNCRNVVTISNNTTEIYIDGCIIQNGYAYTIGGSISVGGGGLRVSVGRAKFKNCIFRDNYTYMRGGAVAIYGSSSRVDFEDCIFENNLSLTTTSSGLGGAAFINAGNVKFLNCRFKSNTAKRGGAISSFQPNLTFDRCIFDGNEAAGSIGGAIDNGSETSLKIYNSLFVGNYAKTGGAAVYTSTTLNVEPIEYANCTFAHNYNDVSGTSYAVYASDKTTVSNCIFWGNKATKQLFHLPPAIEPTVSHCIISGSHSGGTSVSSDDPEFVKPATASSNPFTIDGYDYRVKSSSPAVNGGKNSLVSTLYSKDLQDTTRIKGNTVDLGAYESPYVKFAILLSANPENGGDLQGEGNYFKDSTAQVIATPANACFTFEKWTENGVTASTDSMYSFKVSEDRNLVAHFSQKSYNVILTMEPRNIGTVTGGQVYPCDPDSNRTFIATPSDACYVFEKWTHMGQELGTDSILRYPITSNMLLKAHFKKKEFTIGASQSPNDGGQILGAGIYSCDSLVELIAVSDDCYSFKRWTENGTFLSTDTLLTFSATENRDIQAEFEIKRYAINVVVSPSAAGKVTGDGLKDCGTTTKLEVQRNFNFQFDGWEEDGQIFSSNPVLEFVTDKDRNLKAVFTKTSSISNDSMSVVRVFPNPVRSKFTVSGLKDERHLVELVNAQGQVVLTKNVQGNVLIIDVNNLAAGVYHLRISSPGQVQHSAIRVYK